MKRRCLAIIFLAVFLLSTAGCGFEVFNRKFVRKRKKPAGPPPIYHVQPFVKPPNAEIYSHAFVFWKTWENELLIAMSPAGNPRVVNMLKIRECLQQALSNLADMQKCLDAKKSEELGVYVKQLQGFNAFVENEDLSDMTLARMRHDIETHKRNVDIRFCISAIKNDIKDDSSRAQ